MFRCEKCKIQFSKNSNLRAHVKSKHPDKLDLLAPKIVRKSQFPSFVYCMECDKNYANLGNLRLHVKRQHPGKLDEIAPIDKKTYDCPYCSKNFQTFKTLVIHKRTHKTPIKSNCPLCEYSGCGRENLLIHYKSIHSLEIENECLSFNTVEEFHSWKSRIEEQTLSSFVNADGAKRSASYTTINYNCHRSGVFKSKGKSNRKLKIQGSKKIDGLCPARINVKIKDDKCEVIFCKSHVGHEQDLGHLFLTKSQKLNLAAKIAAKIPFQEILDEVSASASGSHLNRSHLITKKDLYNVQQCFNLKPPPKRSSVCHRNDEITELPPKPGSCPPTELLEYLQSNEGNYHSYVLGDGLTKRWPLKKVEYLPGVDVDEVVTTESIDENIVEAVEEDTLIEADGIELDGQDIIIEADDETMALINTITPAAGPKSSLEEEKKILISEVTEIINSLVTSESGLEAFRNIIAQMKPILEDINAQEQTS